jgi:hypothetical protein
MGNLPFVASSREEASCKEEAGNLSKVPSLFTE